MQFIDVIDVLDGFFYLRKRTPTLHGDAPVRATQACPPFTEGSGFGWELRYSGEGIALEPAADEPVRMLDALTPGFDYAGTVSQARELMSPEWGEQLMRSWHWRDTREPNVLHVWTGLLGRPEPGCAARVTELFNSPHLHTDVRSQTLTDTERYTPIVLSLRLVDGVQKTALRGAVACLSPLPAQSTLATQPLAAERTYAKRLLDYYNADYFAQKLTDPPTRKYARLLREEEPQAPATAADGLALLPSTEDADQLALRHFAPAGPSYLNVFSPCDITLTFLGRGFYVAMGEAWPQRYRSTAATWRTLFGEAGEAYLQQMTFDGESCVHTTPGPPVLVANIEPLLRFAARPGWALLFEGNSTVLRWGLRGCIRSSRFHAGVFAFQWFDHPQDTVIPAGATLGKVIPIPCSLLEATLTERPLSA